MSDKKKAMSRRHFLKTGLQAVALVSLGSVTGFALKKSTSDDLVWQIDPAKCVQCGRCATSCVLNLSAVKCMHVHKMCGYCDLCGGYTKPGKLLDTGAENQLCPTKALKRTFVEEPYYRYDVNEDLCNGCGKCVEGCGSFGNGSLQLQINHDICENCNQCAIAKVCPADAIRQIPAKRGYLLKTGLSKPTT
jgi:Na+-translocating ferredoxin:NAD+ oxidoreductase subunit B